MAEFLDIGIKEDSPEKLAYVEENNIPEKYLVSNEDVMKIVGAINNLATNKASGTQLVEALTLGLAKVYATTSGGNKLALNRDLLMALGDEANASVPNAVVLRQSNRRIKSESPEEPNDLANKGYVDSGLASVVDNHRHFNISVSQTTNVVMISFSEKVAITDLVGITNVVGFVDFYLWNDGTPKPKRDTIAEINADIAGLTTPELALGYTIQFRIVLTSGQSNASAIFKSTKL